MRKVIFFLAVYFVFFAFEKQSPAESLIVKKVAEAQELLKDTEVSFQTEEIKTKVRCTKCKGGFSTKTEEKVTAKESVLKVWDPDEDKFYDVRIRLPYPLPAGNFTFSVLTKDFTVERLYGRYVGKFIFSVTRGGKKLPVLAGKHLWVAPEYDGNLNIDYMEEHAEEVIYTPFADDLFDKEAVLDGARFIKSEVEKALGDLRVKRVVSRALPGKLLADFAPWEYLVNLGTNEQMDHQKFDIDRRRTAEEILIEYAFNREKSFRWAVSSANARGPYQFTDNGNGKALGTYSTVVNAYEEVSLDADFISGTRDLQNMIKAAICLLDMELAKFPPDVHALYAEDYRKAAIYPSAAYNGGYGTAINLFNWIKKNNFEITLDKFDPPSAAYTFYRSYVTYRYVKRGKKTVKVAVKSLKKIVNTETPYYLKKQMYLWQFIDEIKGQL